MSTKVKNIHGLNEVTLTKLPGDGSGDGFNLELRGDLRGGRNFKAQELFDALRAEGFVDKPRTIRDEILDMKVGQRFKIKNIENTAYVRVDGDSFKAETGYTFSMGIHTLAEHYEIAELLPALPKGDEIVRDLGSGVKFTVGDESFIRTSTGQTVSLKDGAVYGIAYFANKTVEVSK